MPLLSLHCGNTRFSYLRFTAVISTLQNCFGAVPIEVSEVDHAHDIYLEMAPIRMVVPMLMY